MSCSQVREFLRCIRVQARNPQHVVNRKRRIAVGIEFALNGVIALPSRSYLGQIRHLQDSQLRPNLWMFDGYET